MLVKLWNDNAHFATFVQGITFKKVVLGSDVTGDKNRWRSFKVNEWDWDQANIFEAVMMVDEVIGNVKYARKTLTATFKFGTKKY